MLQKKCFRSIIKLQNGLRFSIEGCQTSQFVCNRNKSQMCEVINLTAFVEDIPVGFQTNMVENSGRNPDLEGRIWVIA